MKPVCGQNLPDSRIGIMLVRMKLLLVLGSVVGGGLAIWRALEGKAVMGLPLVIVVSARADLGPRHQRQTIPLR